MASEKQQILEVVNNHMRRIDCTRNWKVYSVEEVAGEFVQETILQDLCGAAPTLVSHCLQAGISFPDLKRTYYVQLTEDDDMPRWVVYVEEKHTPIAWAFSVGGKRPLWAGRYWLETCTQDYRFEHLI
jgi:predicted N-acyltransferase